MKAKLYTASGKEFKGSHHEMSNGTIHSGKKHTKGSKRLYKRKPKK